MTICGTFGINSTTRVPCPERDQRVGKTIRFAVQAAIGNAASFEEQRWAVRKPPDCRAQEVMHWDIGNTHCVRDTVLVVLEPRALTPERVTPAFAFDLP